MSFKRTAGKRLQKELAGINEALDTIDEALGTIEELAKDLVESDPEDEPAPRRRAEREEDPEDEPAPRRRQRAEREEDPEDDPEERPARRRRAEPEEDPEDERPARRETRRAKPEADEPETPAPGKKDGGGKAPKAGKKGDVDKVRAAVLAVLEEFEGDEGEKIVEKVLSKFDGATMVSELKAEDYADAIAALEAEIETEKD